MFKLINYGILPPGRWGRGEWGGQFYLALGDLKVLPTSGGGLAKWGVEVFLEGDKGQNLLKSVSLFQVKFDFSIGNSFFRIIS